MPRKQIFPLLKIVIVEVCNNHKHNTEKDETLPCILSKVPKLRDIYYALCGMLRKVIALKRDLNLNTHAEEMKLQQFFLYCLKLCKRFQKVSNIEQ